MFEGHAKAVLRQDGSGVMEIGAHEMGQGARTALDQIATDSLGLDIDRVEFRSGTSDLPDAGIAGDSAHTAPGRRNSQRNNMAVAMNDSMKLEACERSKHRERFL
jgi:CO/xanthine dehydrogenase Mo-binding subunit